MDKFTLLEYMTGHITAEDIAEMVCDDIHANDYVEFNAQETRDACLNLGIDIDDLEDELDLCGSCVLEIGDFDVEGAKQLEREIEEQSNKILISSLRGTKTPAKKKPASKKAPLVFLP